MRARLANRADAASIARIYNEGIEDRTATFETALRSVEDVLAWFDGAHPVVVVEDIAALAEEPGAVVAVIAFARSSEYSPRECYAGVFDFSVYTDRAHRRRGAGALAMRELVTQARAAGAWKLVSRLFIENESSRALLGTLGFREVGTYFRHGKLDGRWRDVVIVEKFLAPAGAEAAIGPPAARPPREQILSLLRSSETHVQGAVHARSLLESHGRPDGELLDASADAFFMAKAHDVNARARFVDLFRSYTQISSEATREVYEALLVRLERWSIAHELDAFYEALFVVKQIARAGDGAHVPGLANQVPRLVEWLKQALELPHAMRTRISPGNVTALLMTLALAGCESEERRQHVAALAAEAKARHRVEPPASLRGPVRSSSLPPPLPTRGAPPPLPRPPPLPGGNHVVVLNVAESEIELDEMAIESVDFLPDVELIAETADVELIAEPPTPLAPTATTHEVAADVPPLDKKEPRKAKKDPSASRPGELDGRSTSKKKRASRPKRSRTKKAD
jgi:phosphinothricin acetyltransferase